MAQTLPIDTPTFHLDAQGFPVPGQVIRYYRERMTYTDSDGKIRRWTQPDLAKRLNVSEITVRLMETQNKYLTLIERRKAIAILLNIPPALLGLASLEDLQRILPNEQSKQLASVTPKNAVDPNDIQLYQDALHVFKNQYEQGELAPQTIESWITRINSTVEQVHGTSKNDILTVLGKYHIIAATTYYHDLQDWTQATNHLYTANNIAKITDNNELLAVSYYHAGEMYGNQGNNLLARKELDFALSFSKSASSQVKGNILTYVAQAHALTGVDEADRLYVRRQLDEAEKHVTENIDNNTLIKFDMVQYLEGRADTLITLKRFSLALECIDEAEEYLITKRRNIEFLKILRAECYVKQRKAEYEQATELLSQILDSNKSIQYYVNYVAKLHKLIAASPYGNAPAAVDLGMALRALKVKK